MDIYAKPGTQVVFEGEGGYKREVEDAINCGLHIGMAYTVKRTEVHNWMSYVELEEIEGKFNTVMFS